MLDSQQMTLRLTEDKANALQKLCLKIKSRNTVSIRKVAKLLGCMTASFAGVMYGPLYSKQLEVEKTHYLKLNQGNFDANMTLSSAAKKDLQWWIDSLPNAYNVKRLLRLVGRWARKPVNHTSWVAVALVTPTDRPKSVRNRCLIELFCGVVCVVALPF